MYAMRNGWKVSTDFNSFGFIEIISSQVLYCNFNEKMTSAEQVSEKLFSRTFYNRLFAFCEKVKVGLVYFYTYLE